jgi:hypothetical protein
VEFKAVRGIILCHEGSQLVGYRLFLPSIPEVFNFLAKGRIFWLVEPDRESLVKLKWCGFSVTLSGQVEDNLGLGSQVAPTVFEPFVNLLEMEKG